MDPAPTANQIRNRSEASRPMAILRAHGPTRRRVGHGWVWAERTAWTFGGVALLVWALVSAAGWLGARQELQRFEAVQSATAESASILQAAAPDQRLWSPERVTAWFAAQTGAALPPLAVLRISRLGIEAPVLEGTGEWTLNRAVG